MCAMLACRFRRPCSGSCKSAYLSYPPLTCAKAFSTYSPPSNFVIALTFPPLLQAFSPQGAFGWYAAWNAVGFVIILLFVPETKALSLEELDQGMIDYA